MDRYTEDESPTRTRSADKRTDLHHTVGQLMVESINLRKRVETLEAMAENAGLAPGSMPPVSKYTRLFRIIKTTFTATVISIAAIIQTLKELGYLGGH